MRGTDFCYGWRMHGHTTQGCKGETKMSKEKPKPEGERRSPPKIHPQRNSWFEIMNEAKEIGWHNKPERARGGDETSLKEE